MGNIRTGKDADHRQSLNEAARAARPATPAGALVLTEEDLGAVVGGLRGSPHNPLREQRLPQGRHPPSCPRQHTAPCSMESAPRQAGAGAGRGVRTLAGRLTRERKEMSHAVCPP